MCGITGWFQFGGEPVDRERLLRMTRTLRHRGPDAEGIWTCRLGGLGHTRLSIIDLSSAGSQPMVSADGRYVIAYNGELYNYRELREQLVTAGISFRGRSDTEVMVNGFAVWGPDSFRRFNGIFACAIWDNLDERLWLARDRLGVKPLYYCRTGRSVLFGSEIKALLAAEQVSARLNAARLREFLYFGVTLGRETLYQGVQRLLPGHWLAADCTEWTEKPYWRLDEIRPVLDSYPEAAERVRALVEAAVRRQLVSDVPVGIFLSGGIDSACVATFAAKNSTQRIRTFSVGFDYDRGVNELPKARTIAQALNAEHHELHVSGTDLPATLQALIQQHDQPFSDAANIPLYLLAGKVADQVKVVLQGDGGDEVFGGYRRYALLRSSSFWVTAARCAKWSGLSGLIEAKAMDLAACLQRDTGADAHS